jgi:hypothetical protein
LAFREERKKFAHEKKGIGEGNSQSAEEDELDVPRQKMRNTIYRFRTEVVFLTGLYTRTIVAKHVAGTLTARSRRASTSA